MNSPALNCTAGEDLGRTTRPFAIGQLSWGSPIPLSQNPKIVANQVAISPAAAAPPIGCFVIQTLHRRIGSKTPCWEPTAELIAPPCEPQNALGSASASVRPRRTGVNRVSDEFG